MTRFHAPWAAGLLLLALTVAPLRAGDRETKTVEQATEAVRGLAAIPLKGIPQQLLQDAAGVVIIPEARKAAPLVDREFGRGVLLAARTQRVVEQSGVRDAEGTRHRRRGRH